MTALRCSTCGINWPSVTGCYGTCPQCLAETDRMDNAEPIDKATAASLKYHAEFERFYNGPWQERKRRESEERLERELAQLNEAVGDPFPEGEPA